MTKLFELHSKNNRERHNRDLLNRMKTGENLQRFTAESSWFPPRPVIKKDLDAIDMLYHREKRESSLVDLPHTRKP